MKKDSSELLTTVKKEARRVAGALEHAAESLLGTKPGKAAKKVVKTAATRVKRAVKNAPQARASVKKAARVAVQRAKKPIRKAAKKARRR